MKTYWKPGRTEWPELTTRPVIDQGELTELVISVINDVRREGDKALVKYASRFDGVELNNLTVSEEEIKEAVKQIPQELKEAIELAYNNIFRFHKAQQIREEVVETVPGVKCWRKSLAIEKVGLYIPGGSAPLFSTILMLGIPAKIAGCREIVLCYSSQQKGGDQSCYSLYGKSGGHQ